jgi:FkbM family methyltransferase
MPPIPTVINQQEKPMRRELRFELARRYAWFWRFKNLQFAERLFNATNSPCIVSRPFYGYKLFLDVSRTNAQKLLYLQGERFVAEHYLIANLVKPNGYVIDVGANIGYYLLMLQSLVGPNGSIVCFEPEPDNLSELRLNIKYNNVNNVELIESAVGMTEGTVSFARGINGEVRDDNSGDILVPMVSLDRAIKRKVDFIKIDVEGYEAHVLIGAENLIKKFRPALFVEIHPRFLTPQYTAEDIVAFAASYYQNVSFYQAQDQSNQSAFEKIQTRYLGKESIKSGNADTFIHNCLSGAAGNVFWMVCT